MIPMASLPEIANGLALLSIITMLAMSRGSRSYFRAALTIDAATRPRLASATPLILKKVSMAWIAGSITGTIWVGKLASTTAGPVAPSEKMNALGVGKPRTITAKNTVKINNLEDVDTHFLQSK